jgi:hypothetical protein
MRSPRPRFSVAQGSLLLNSIGYLLSRLRCPPFVVALARYSQGRGGSGPAGRPARAGHRGHGRDRPGTVFRRSCHHRGPCALVLTHPFPPAVRDASDRCLGAAIRRLSIVSARQTGGHVSVIARRGGTLRFRLWRATQEHCWTSPSLRACLRERLKRPEYAGRAHCGLPIRPVIVFPCHIGRVLRVTHMSQ